MSYLRVIPRDVFNEASLLKCLGKLCLDIHDRKLPFMTVDLEEGTEEQGFIIEQNENSGALYCSNLLFTINKAPIRLERPLNSRKAWPLYLETENESIEVFDEKGNVLLTKKTKV